MMMVLMSLYVLPHVFLTLVCYAGSNTTKPVEPMEEMMKRLGIILMLVILLTACGPKPQDVIDGWQQELNKGYIEAALSYLAEDVVVSVSPPGPGEDGVYEGKQELRNWYATIVATKGKGTMRDCKADGDSYTCISRYEDEGLRSIGVDFIEGSWVAIVQDGKIQSYTFTTSPESLAKFPPPEPVVEEARITTPETLVGSWVAKSGNISVLHMFQANGTVVASIPGYGTISTGPYVFEDDLLKFEDRTGDCMGIVALYEVYGIYEQGELSKLRFVLVGEDACGERRETLNGQTLDKSP
jgi:hypothetical protein